MSSQEMSKIHVTKGNRSLDLTMADTVARTALESAVQMTFSGMDRTTSASGITLSPSVMVGATGSSDGRSGVVPQPKVADQGNFLRGDGKWISMSSKADKTVPSSAGNLATLNSSGNLADSGVASTVLTSKAGASGGTELSLVTTGEKYTWNNWVDATYQIPIEPVIIGGRAYNVVTIGNQQWMAENLDYKYTGLTICNTNNPMTNTVIDSDAATENIIKGATYYDYDETTYGINGNRYGLLYNWPAVEYLENNKNALGIPTGWRVPTETDFKTLRTNAGGFTDSRIKLASLSGWSNGNNGTDDYGFNGVPAGYGIGYQDIFNNITNMTSYWSISPDSTDSDYTVYANLGLNNNSLDIQTDRRYVFNSVRLVRDIT